MSPIRPVDVTAGLSLLYLIALRMLRGHIVFFWFAALPGIVVHELSHWIVAFVTLGFPGFPRFLPRRVPGGYIMARVPIHHPTWYNGAFIGLSPLLLLPMAYQALQLGTPTAFAWANLLYFLLTPLVTAELLLECLPSPPDLRLVRKSAIPLVLLGVAGWLYWKGLAG